MKSTTTTALFLFFITLITLASTSCATGKYVMKNCEKQADGFFVCEKPAK